MEDYDLVPVDHDPFATPKPGMTVPPADTGQAAARLPGQIAQGAWNASGLGDVYNTMRQGGTWTDVAGAAVPALMGAIQPEMKGVGAAEEAAAPTIAKGIVGSTSPAAGANIARMGAAASIPKQLFHVAPADVDVSQGLRSLYDQHGPEAYGLFNQRWPESGGIGEYHAHNVMFYDNLKDAQSHVDAFGGQILTVDPSKLTSDLRFDKLEQPGFWVTNGPVPKEAISPFQNPNSSAAAQPQPSGIRAFHGSPYDFDRFDISKIGTGEGAQAYGHGLYFAEHPETAQAYRDILTDRNIVFDDNLVNIIKKYGIAGLIAGGGAHFSTQPVDNDPFGGQSNAIH